MLIVKVEQLSDVSSSLPQALPGTGILSKFGHCSSNMGIQKQLKLSVLYLSYS